MHYKPVLTAPDLLRTSDPVEGAVVYVLPFLFQARER